MENARDKPPLTAETLTERSSDRQDAILDAAFHAFANYGFRRTTMDDIARATGISRPALYLRYRNKEMIFRSLAERHYASAVKDMETALAKPGLSPEEQLHLAFVAKGGAVMEALLSTPHGADLLDAGFQVAGDIAKSGEDKMRDLLAAWIARQNPGDLGEPQSLAGTMLAGLMGLKSTHRTLDAYQAGVAQLARVFARALNR